MSGLNTTCICYVTVSGCWRFRDSIARPSAQSFTKPQEGGQPGHVLSRRPDRGRVHRQTHSGTGRSHGLHRGWRAWCFAGCWWEATCSSQRPPYCLGYTIRPAHVQREKVVQDMTTRSLESWGSAYHRLTCASKGTIPLDLPTKATGHTPPKSTWIISPLPSSWGLLFSPSDSTHCFT